VSSVEVAPRGSLRLLVCPLQTSFLGEGLWFVAGLNCIGIGFQVHRLVLIPEERVVEVLGDASPLVWAVSLSESSLILDALQHSVLPSLGYRAEKLKQPCLLARVCFGVSWVEVCDGLVKDLCQSGQIGGARLDSKAFDVGEGWRESGSRRKSYS